MHLWQNPSHTDAQTYRARKGGIIQIILYHLRAKLRSKMSEVSESAHASRNATQTQHDIEMTSANHTNAGINHAPPVSAAQITSPSADSQHSSPSVSPGCFRSSYVFLRTPKKLGDQMHPDDEDPPEGWGLYFEEGFQVHHFFMVLLFLYILGSLIFGTYWCSKYGLVGPQSGAEAFSVSSWMIALVSLIIVVWFKWAD